VKHRLLGLRVGVGPLLRRLGQAESGPQAGAVGVDPLSQPRPAPDQRLVGDLQRPLARGRLLPLGGEQTRLGVGPPGADRARLAAGGGGGGSTPGSAPRRAVPPPPPPGGPGPRNPRGQSSCCSGVTPSNPAPAFRCSAPSIPPISR